MSNILLFLPWHYRSLDVEIRRFLRGKFFTICFDYYCCSVAKSCPTLCDPMDCSMPGFPVLHCLQEFAQTHVHWVDDAIQSSHPLWPHLLLPSIFLSVTVFSNELALHMICPKYWSFSISPSNEYLRLVSFRIDWFDLLASKGLSRVFSSITVRRHQFFGTQPFFFFFFYCPAVTSVHDSWFCSHHRTMPSPH